jgi:cytoskeletal protein CcmA (bactofilin family)
MDNSNKNSDPLQDGSQSLEGSSIDTTSPDALSSSNATAQDPSDGSTAKPKKGPGLPGPLKKYAHRFNIYLLFFMLILVLAGAILVITALAGKETQNDPSAISNQNLSTDTLKQLSNTDATVGDPKQILNVQSNAIFAGKVLVRDSLEVAGQIKVGGALSLPGITVSGESNFDTVNTTKALNVGGDASVQGQLNVKRNIAVSGGGTFGGPVSAPQLSTSNLQLLGDLTLTRHITAGGAAPGRAVGTAVGGGGSASVSGSDTAGFVNINTGSGPSAGCFVTINFVARFNGTPRVLLTPVGSDAGAIGYYTNRNSTSFSICTSNVPPANASFGFDYFVLN